MPPSHPGNRPADRQWKARAGFRTDSDRMHRIQASKNHARGRKGRAKLGAIQRPAIAQSETMWDVLLTDCHAATMTRRGEAYGAIREAAVAIADGRIAWIGPAKD